MVLNALVLNVMLFSLGNIGVASFVFRRNGAFSGISVYGRSSQSDGVKLTEFDFKTFKEEAGTKMLKPQEHLKTQLTSLRPGKAQ
jgi:hypothetical protein